VLINNQALVGHISAQRPVSPRRKSAPDILAPHWATCQVPDRSPARSPQHRSVTPSIAVSAAWTASVSALSPSIDCDEGTGRQVSADPRDDPSPLAPLLRGGRHRQYGGRLQTGMGARLQIRTVRAIRSVWVAASRWNPQPWCADRAIWHIVGASGSSILT
jgi:hypothetical protein